MAQSPTRSRAGRPRKRLPPNGLEIISELASRGVQETELAQALGMTFKTWQRIREEDPAARDAWEAAKAIERDQLTGLLFEKAMGGDTTSAMFLLKTRHGYRDHGAVEAASDASRLNVTFNIPAALNVDQYRQLVTVHQDALPAPEGGDD